MVINYCGEGCFKIQSGKLNIAADPLPRFKGDVVLWTKFPISSSQFPNTEIAGAGEYEIQGSEIRGWQLPKESNEKEIRTIYSVKVEEMNLAFLGALTESLDPGFLEKIGAVDILFMPACGKPLIDEAAASKLIKQINPKIVIGSHIKGVDGAKKFFKELEQKPDLQDKLVIKKKDLPSTTKTMALKA